jgi:hypothetical protein
MWLALREMLIETVAHGGLSGTLIYRSGLIESKKALLFEKEAKTFAI